ncbi:MAG: CIS tube protein [Planctomycetota bacterium]|jgi:hypothetical protein
MPGGFRNRPKILRGAFVEYGLSLPPMIVVFQFNPVQLTRNRSLTFRFPNEPTAAPVTLAPGETEEQAQRKVQRRVAASRTSLRQFHHTAEFSDLLKLQKQQIVDVQEESISFEIRLDATDKLDEGDLITEQFGIAPQLATLELMTLPKGESLLGAALGLVGTSAGHSYTEQDRPPLILFIWGRKRVLPVNINSMNITESEFSTDLNPIRATVSVSLTVIEGPNAPYTYSKAMKEAMSVLNLANIADVANVAIPG